MPAPVLDLAYSLHGDFIEACDCYVVCPCWVDDDPDEGHCTGLIAWTLGEGSSIDGVDVAGLTVVSVSTHTGSRRGNGTATALYVGGEADADQYAMLVAAFAGRLGGQLQDLAAVSGAVVTEQRAWIRVTDEGRDRWCVRVTVDGEPGGSQVELVHATGGPQTFDDRPQYFTLSHTALSKELGIPTDPDEARVTAQRGAGLGIHVATLPGGYLDVTGRSGMRGRFEYEHPGPKEPKRDRDRGEDGDEPDEGGEQE